jgi:hypothetical protein
MVPSISFATGALAALTIAVAPLAAVSQPSTAPAPRVLAWASFLGDDAELTSISTWSSGEAWYPLVGNWTQVEGAAATTRTTANARAVASLPAAGNTARVVARVMSVDGSPVQSGGVVAAASLTGTRVALIALVHTDGSLQIRRVAGGGAASTVLASSAPGAIISSSVELSLQHLDGTATATATPLDAATPAVTIGVPLGASLRDEISGSAGYGIVSHSTTNVTLDAVRVER